MVRSEDLVPTDSGSVLDCHLCPDCGACLFHTSRRDPFVVSVKAGSLDDKSVISPIGHIWTDRAHPWFTIPEGSLTTARDP